MIKSKSKTRTVLYVILLIAILVGFVAASALLRNPVANEAVKRQLNFALQANDAEEYQDALAVYFPLALKGYARAQTNLGEMFSMGRGLPRLERLGNWLHHLAAVKGDSHGQVRMGFIHALGDFVPKNENRAVYWFRLAANQGDPEGQQQLADAYWDGVGVPQSYSKAFHLYRLAAVQGHPEHQFILALHYDVSEPAVLQDKAEAARWYKLSAEQGYLSSQFLLGNLYAKGEGVPQSNRNAYLWYSAGAYRDAEAANARDMMAKQLTYGQISEVQSKIARCAKNEYQNCDG